MPTVTSIHWSPESPADQLPGKGAVMRRVPIKAGHVATRHHHDFEQFLFVLSGGGRLECEQGGIALSPAPRCASRPAHGIAPSLPPTRS